MPVSAIVRVVGLMALVALVSACGASGAGSGGNGGQEGTAGEVFLVSVSRPTDGTIRSTDGQIECGSAVTANRCGPASYAWTAIATLNAIPDTGKMFGTWAGDCVGRGACVLSTASTGADKTVAAAFGEMNRVQHANWMDPATHGPEFLEFVRNGPEHFECDYCHSSTYDGLGIAPSCNSCHAQAGHADWRTDCTFCHAAPPSTQSHDSVPLQDPPAVGACAICHFGTVNSDGTIRAGGGHMNGKLDIAGGTGGFGCAACHGAPPSTGAHLSHVTEAAPPAAYGDVTPLGCGNCHPTDPAQHFGGARLALSQDVVLPGGTTTAGAVMTGAGTSVTCMVACHFPLGASQPAAPIAWTAGPLSCKDCHSRIVPPDLGGNPTGNPPAGPSLHDPPYADAGSGEATTCSSCHDLASHEQSHVTGEPALVDGSSRDAKCVACHTPPAGPTGPSQVLHRGSGATYEEKTPPVLPGWADAVSGDFHGARAGAGFGGSLAEGYSRGQGPLPCSDCHASHASGNAFGIAAMVNGTAIPSGTITRAGQGAEQLCGACHLGDRHAGCQAVDCHGGDPVSAGSPCFMCHGHEGIRNFPQPVASDHPLGEGGCEHCHPTGGPLWPPVATYSPNTFTAQPQTSGLVGATSATIIWSTSRAATTWLEYGVGTAGYVRGSSVESTAHSVTLTGLEPGTTYVFRVRAVDAFRNVLRSATRTFTTPAADGLSTPVNLSAAVGTLTKENDYGSGPATLSWSAVTSPLGDPPLGNPVEYEVQVASNSGFTEFANLVAPTSSVWLQETSWEVGLVNVPLDQACQQTAPENIYYFRVRARDSIVTSTVSEWSQPKVFSATLYECD